MRSTPKTRATGLRPWRLSLMHTTYKRQYMIACRRNACQNSKHVIAVIYSSEMTVVSTSTLQTFTRLLSAPAQRGQTHPPGHQLQRHQTAEPLFHLPSQLEPGSKQICVKWTTITGSSLLVFLLLAVHHIRNLSFQTSEMHVAKMHTLNIKLK